MNKNLATKEQLAGKAYLPNGVFGNIFKLLKGYAVQCELCNTRISSTIVSVNQHIQGKKHRGELKRSNAREKGAPQKPQKWSPGVPEPSYNTSIQEHLGTVQGSLIGLEYILEVAALDDTKKAVYFCVLCINEIQPQHCTPATAAVLHLQSHPHKINYIKMHFPTAFERLELLLTNTLKAKSLYSKKMVDKIADAIETTFGRLKPAQVDPLKFKDHRNKYLDAIRKVKHHEERPGLNFEDLITRHDIFKTSEGRHETVNMVTSPTIERNRMPQKGQPDKKDMGEISEIYDHLEKELLKYKENPEDHPQYNEEWVKFWKQKYIKLQAHGKDPSTYDFKPEWKEFWNKRIMELHIEAKKYALEKKLAKDQEATPSKGVKFASMDDSQTLARKRRRSESPPGYENSPSRRIEPRTPRGGSPSRLKNFSGRGGSPSRRKESPSSRRESPVHRRESPARRRESPLRRRDSNTRVKDSPSIRRESQSRRKESPSRRRESPSRRKESPSRRRESPSRRKESPSRRKESPPRRRESPSRLKESSPRRRESPSRLKESSPRRRESPSRRRESPPRRRGSPSDRRVSPSRLRYSPPRRRDSPYRPKESPSRRRESPSYRRESPSRRRESPSRRRGSPPRDRSPLQHESKRQRRMSDQDSSYIEKSREQPNMRKQKLDLQATDDGIISVLRLITAVEERLGSLGPKIVDLLSEALYMESNKVNSSEDLLNDKNCILLTTVKEKFRGQLQAGLVSGAQVEVYNTIIRNIGKLVEKANQRKKLKRGESMNDAMVMVPGVGAVDRDKVTREIVNSLLAQGKRDITEKEMLQFIKDWVKNGSKTELTNRYVIGNKRVWENERQREETKSLVMSMMSSLNKRSEGSFSPRNFYNIPNSNESKFPDTNEFSLDNIGRTRRNMPHESMVYEPCFKELIPLDHFKRQQPLPPPPPSIREPQSQPMMPPAPRTVGIKGPKLYIKIRPGSNAVENITGKNMMSHQPMASRHYASLTRNLPFTSAPMSRNSLNVSGYNNLDGSTDRMDMTTIRSSAGYSSGDSSTVNYLTPYFQMKLLHSGTNPMPSNMRGGSFTYQAKPSLLSLNQNPLRGEPFNSRSDFRSIPVGVGVRLRGDSNLAKPKTNPSGSYDNSRKGVLSNASQPNKGPRFNKKK